MDELVKALAELIRTGNTLALPALVGYYVVRIVEPICYGLTVFALGRLLTGMVRHVSDNNTRARLGLTDPVTGQRHKNHPDQTVLMEDVGRPDGKAVSGL